MIPRPFRILRNDAAAAGDAGGGAAAGSAAAESSASAGASGAATQAQSAPTALVNPDGSWANPDWHKSLGVEISNADRFKDFASLVKSYDQLEKHLSGKPMPASAPLAVPAADASPEVWKGYREAQGIPLEPTGYQLKPEKLPDGAVWSEEAGKHFAGVFHKNNVPAAVGQAIVADFVAFEADQNRQLAEAYQNKLKESEAALQKEWGGDYGKKVDQIKTVVSTLGYDPNDVSIFSNPAVVGFLGKVVGQLTPDSLGALGVTVGSGGQMLSGKDEVKSIMTDPNHPEYKRYHEGDPTVVDKVRRLAATY